MDEQKNRRTAPKGSLWELTEEQNKWGSFDISHGDPFGAIFGVSHRDPYGAIFGVFLIATSKSLNSAPKKLFIAIWNKIEYFKYNQITKGMKENIVEIKYTDDLLLSLKESKKQFEKEAKYLLALKLYELGKISSGKASKIAGISRVQFIMKLAEYNVSPFQADLEEILGEADDL